ncbi:MAG TPA: isocitrate lyase/phosphoenolpyruvate mutase family protein [Gemmatimonadaceae bacterium]|nr:isocitrate lyase/phosphoenolpyruvate mutase family protein [Gemmatimonadaceae bacterium]
MTQPDRARTFRRLHESGCFVMPNPWDIGGARLLAHLGFRALASTSSGSAWTMGRRDNHLTVDESLSWLRVLSGAVELPINADFEGGFAIEPDGVAANVGRAALTGIAGVSIEDSTGDAANPLFDRTLAVERVRAARQAIDASGRDVVLTGRSEGFITGRPDLAETIRRLAAYAEAGADCLYAPGLRSMSDISDVVRAVSPKPVNVLVSSGFTTVNELAELGVRRISVGGALARVAWGAVLTAAREIAGSGTFNELSGAASSKDIEAAFAAPDR